MQLYARLNAQIGLYPCANAVMTLKISFLVDGHQWEKKNSNHQCTQIPLKSHFVLDQYEE